MQENIAQQTSEKLEVIKERLGKGDVEKTDAEKQTDSEVHGRHESNFQSVKFQ